MVTGHFTRRRVPGPARCRVTGFEVVDIRLVTGSSGSPGERWVCCVMLCSAGTTTRGPQATGTSGASDRVGRARPRAGTGPRPNDLVFDTVATNELPSPPIVLVGERDPHAAFLIAGEQGAGDTSARLGAGPRRRPAAPDAWSAWVMWIRERDGQPYRHLVRVPADMVRSAEPPEATATCRVGSATPTARSRPGRPASS
jgi:hypothetical protein